MSWTLKYPYGGSEVSIQANYRNVTGAPVSSISVPSAQASGSMPLLAGVFRFTFESAASISVSYVNSGEIESPLLFTGTKLVTCDGSTINWNLIPGVGVVFSPLVTLGNVFEIGLGCYWDSSNAQWVRALPLGAGLPGMNGTVKTVVAANGAGYTQSNTKAVATNAIRIDNDQAYNRPFLCFRQTGLLNPTADSDLSGANVTFDNFSAGSPNTVDILVDGATIDVYDVTNETLISGGTGLECDGTTVYRFADGTKYQSGEFILSSSLVGSDTATIYVSDGGESVQLSTDQSSWVSGPTGIYLSGADAVSEGIVAASESVSFYVRLRPSSTEDSDLNQRQFSLRVESYGV